MDSKKTLQQGIKYSKQSVTSRPAYRVQPDGQMVWLADRDVSKTFDGTSELSLNEGNKASKRNR